MVILEPPKKWPNQKNMNKYHVVTVLVRSEDPRPEGAWDLSYEIQRSLELSFGDALIQVGWPQPQKWTNDPEGYRLKPRYKD